MVDFYHKLKEQCLDKERMVLCIGGRDIMVNC